jgi:DNA-binding transcriptional ArsR family regulator
MEERNPAIVDVMAAPAGFTVEVVAGTPFELLVLLFAAAAGRPGSVPDSTRAALAAVGDRSGEVWLHLLGLALEFGEGDTAAFVEHVARTDALELRRHILGLYVPSWCHLVGAETIDRAARGNAAACAQLLANRRYYGGNAAKALTTILPLGGRETKTRIVTALRGFNAEVFAAGEAEVATQLAADAETKRRLQPEADLYDLIDLATRGYRYEAEPEFPRVVLIPHIAAAPSILLCQHRDARLICYPASTDAPSQRELLLTVGRALADKKRIAILERLRASDATLGQLADTVGLAKSTTHHHLGQLRAARLVALRGNAAGYIYTLDTTGFEIATRLLGAFAGNSA